MLVPDVEPGRIWCLDTLSAAQVEVQQLSDTERKKLPRYPVPCFRMGRLARHSAQAGTGLGEVLMGCIFTMALWPVRMRP